MEAKTCRNATEILSPHRGRMIVCPCSGNADGACACTPTSTYGMAAGADRNLCGCWPEPEAPKATRRACRCGAALSPFERRHGLQCGACTRRDEAFYGAGVGL